LTDRQQEGGPALNQKKYIFKSRKTKYHKNLLTEEYFLLKLAKKVEKIKIFSFTSYPLSKRSRQVY